MTPAFPEPLALAAAVSGRDRLALARALNLLDDRRPAARQCAAAFLDALPAGKLDSSGHLIGITGPPGAGKSSLTAMLIQVWRRRGLKVAILAVDPSSPISGGALLGDRLRMHASGADREVFIRSLACRGEFGGLSAEVWPMSLAMLAAFEHRAGGNGGRRAEGNRCFQDDRHHLLRRPAGLRRQHPVSQGRYHGSAARHCGQQGRHRHGGAQNPVRIAQYPAAADGPEGWQVPALSASAALGSGIEQLADALDAHRRWLLERGQFTARRQRCQAEWLVKHLREEFGRYGIGLLGGDDALFVALTEAPRRSPIAEYETLRARVIQAIKAKS